MPADGHQEGNQLLKADEPELAIERYEGALEVLGRVGGGANELFLQSSLHVSR